MKNSTVKDIVLAVTYRCNSRCRMCSIWQIKNHDQELSASDMNNLPIVLKSVNLSGGEPFLRADLPEIVAAVRKRCPAAKITISSNGFATERILDLMKEIIKIDRQIGVAISLDGIGIAHDEVRGVAGGFDKAMKTLRGLKELGVKNLRLAFTIGDYNYFEMRKVYELSKKESVEMTLAVVHSSENFFGQENRINSSEKIITELRWLMREELSSWNIKHWLRAYFVYGLIEFIRSGRRVLPDYSGSLNCFINPQGAIFPCDISPEIIGDLKKGFVISDSVKKIPESWMICTAREAMRRHWFRVGMWILKNKFFKIK